MKKMPNRYRLVEGTILATRMSTYRKKIGLIRKRKLLRLQAKKIIRDFDKKKFVMRWSYPEKLYNMKITKEGTIK